MSRLQDILPRLGKPRKFPSQLPLIHVSTLGSFAEIINDLHLRPSDCRVFKRDILYFSYGNAFYTTGNDPDRKQTQFPIFFLFNPQILSQIYCYYPYDTGAANKGIYGLHSNYLKDNFDKYKIDGSCDIQSGEDYIRVCRQLVYYIYGTNRNYIDGQIKTRIQSRLCNSLPDLFQFFEDPTIDNCDERQYTIECQTEESIKLNNVLEWVAFPRSQEKLFIELFDRMQPSPPMRCPYNPGAVNHPLKIFGHIRAEAQKYIENRYLEIENR
jgi:hypothetical protein